MKNCRIYICACFVLQVERASSLTADIATSNTSLSLAKATERKCGGYQIKRPERNLKFSFKRCTSLRLYTPEIRASVQTSIQKL